MESTLSSGLSIVQPVSRPTLKGLTQEDIKNFAAAWQTYVNICVGASRDAESLKDAISPSVLATICNFMLPTATTVDKVTEDELKTWLNTFAKEALATRSVEQLVRQSLRMVKNGALPGRVRQLMVDFQELTRQAGRDNFILLEQSQTVELITSRLEPPMFRRRVELDLQTDQHALRADVKGFFQYLTTEAAWLDRYLDLMPSVERKSAKPSGPSHEKKEEAKGATPQASGERQPAPQASGERQPVCWKCGGSHKIWRCPNATWQEVAEMKEKKLKPKDGGNSTTGGAGLCLLEAEQSRCQTVLVNHTKYLSCKLDSGAGVTAMGRNHLEKLRAVAPVKTELLQEPMRITAAFGKTSGATETAQLDLELQSIGGPLLLKNVTTFIVDEDLPCVFIGNPLLKQLGIDVDAALGQVAEKSSEYDCALDSLENLPLESDHHQGTADKLLAAALAQGLSNKDAVAQLLQDYKDIFRTELGRDPPASVPPMQIKLIQGATQVKCKPRRYSPAHQAYLKEHIKELLDNSLIEPVTSPAWVSPVFVVPKGKDGYRMTVDLRSVNAVTVPDIYPLPLLDAVATRLQGSTIFGSYDLFKGYWQVPLEEKDREALAFMTPEGTFAPKRLLMGATNGVAHFQRVMDQLLEPIRANCVVYLDDVLLHASSEDEFLRVTAEFYAICDKAGLKISAAKSRIYAKQVKFCGRLYDGETARYDPERIRTLVELPTPENAALLMQFVAAANWMRQSLPCFAETIAPLRELLEAAYSKAGSRKKKRAAGILLADLWQGEHEEAFRKAKALLQNAVQLWTPKADQTICVFADASLGHWAGIITAVPDNQLSLPPCKQTHYPVAFASGSFTGAAYRWSIVEKEAYALVSTTTRFNWITQQPKAIFLYTDHANLCSIFSPQGLPEHTARKLLRWGSLLSEYQYKILPIKGEDNVWADMLSRWLAPTHLGEATSLCGIWEVQPLYPSTDDSFVWPSEQEIRQLQHPEDATAPLSKDDQGRVIIPDNQEGENLKMRLCIVAHTGSSGHRGVEATYLALKEVFFWPKMKADVTKFVDGCLHCVAALTGERIPRPLASTLHADAPNQILHFDFLSLYKKADYPYALVLKDDFSNFVRIIPCTNCTAMEAARGITEWVSTFGHPLTLISDNGSHFRNSLLEELKQVWGVAHKFHHSYTPWANGTVEIANRDLLKVLRPLRTELRVPSEQWHTLVPLLQSALNNAPRERLEGKAPLQLFTSLPTSRPIETILREAEPTVGSINWEDFKRKRAAAIDAACRALDQIHKETAENKAKGRAAARRTASRLAQPVNFDTGDYVLVAVPKKGAKLEATWVGPRRVTKVVNSQIVVVQDLVSDVEAEVHISRLRLFSEKYLHISEDLKNFIEFNTLYEVDSFQGERKNEFSGGYELLTAWRGFDVTENTWEPVSHLLGHVPELVKRYAADKPWLLPGNSA